MNTNIQKKFGRGLAMILVAGALVGACRDDSTTNPVPGTDSGNPGTDSGNPGTDGGTGRDSTTPTDVQSTGVSMAVLTNPMAAGHPAARAVVTVTDTNLVALSPRLFISGPSASNKCSYAAWVGTSTGGDFSAIELFESIPAAPGTDGGTADCFAASVVGNIPADLAIGDTLGALRGTNDPYCPTGSTCPAGTSAEFNVGSTYSGVVTVSGHGGTVPAPTMVHVADIAGMASTLGPRDLALQGSLVQLTGTLMVTAPSTTNHDNMTVAESMAAGSPSIAVLVGKYRGVTCQRTALGAAPVGFAVGSVTGLLEYSYGAWTIQPRQASDLPGVVCAATDGGTGTDAATGTDATSGTDATAPADH